MNPKLNIMALTETSLYKKFGIAFIFMSLVPIILILFIIHHFNITPILESRIPYFHLTVLLTVLLSLASFDLVRRSMTALIRFTRSAKEIANGNFYKRVVVDEKDEIGLLAQSFNKITGELEGKIHELESSKELLQSILQKVGTAVTSIRGIDNLLELIIESLAKGADATSGAIVLLDEAGSRLRIKVSFGMAKGMDKLVIRADEGLIGRVVRFKKAEAASNVRNNVTAYFEYDNRLASDSILAAPLIYKERVLGVIIISDKKNKDAFNNDDIILLTNVAAQTAVAIANFQLNEDAEKTYLETITALAVAVEAKDQYSRGHLERVAGYVDRIGREMHLDDEMMKVLHSGAVLHDIGKIGIRDEILKKTSSLTEEEEKEMREHVLIGVNIIKPIRSMAALCELVRYHQEFYDGSGYPDGLKGEEIPLTARILKVCDAYDAMTTDRPYRKALTKEEAKQELLRKSGKEFDPQVVGAFLKMA